VTSPTQPIGYPPQPPQGKPGYYPDNQGAMRWWTGDGWTDHIMGQATVAQPPQERKKKPGVLRWALFIVLVLVVLIAGCTALLTDGETAAPPTTGEESTAVEPSSNDGEPPAEKTYKIGEKATDDSYEFTVTKIKCGVSKVGDSYSAEKAQGQFCLVSLRVKNVGNDPINFSDENQALVDTKGKNYSPDDEAWIYLDSDPYAEINPGNTLKTIVPFDLPKYAKPDHLLLKAGFWGASEGVVVKL
jgi:archaellum component FlaG (FlaF/FlaG flagellin family)